MSDRFIRVSTAATVVAIGGVAAYVSYRHALEVATAHGETGDTGRLVPLTVDGLVYVASMVMLDAARRQVAAPPLARLALALGIGATIAVNVLHGVAHGLVGAVISAWPAVCLVVVVELLMGLIRRGRAPVATPALDEDAGMSAAVDTLGEKGLQSVDTLTAEALPWWPVPAIVAAGRDHVEDVPHMVGPDVLATGARDEGDDHVPGAAKKVGDEAEKAHDVPNDPDLAPVVATARDRFAEVLAAGGLPSVRAIRRGLRVGHPRAVAVRAALESEVGRDDVPVSVSAAPATG